jgi:alkyl hydroperoxide reductase subunit D
LLKGEARSTFQIQIQGSIMLDALLETLPDYAKDLRLNFSSLVRQQTELSTQQKWGTLVASALACRNAAFTAAVVAEAGQHISAQVIDAAKAAAAIMAMNNVYYRFQHLSSNQKYATLPARLRMNVMRTHGVDAVDFELWALAVSAINACGKCVSSHEQVLREKSISEEVILAAVRLASVVHGIATVLDAVAAEQKTPELQNL